MDKAKQWMRKPWFGLVLALAFAGGATLAWLGAHGHLSYTEPRSNPSASGDDIVAVGVTARDLPTDFVFSDGDGRPLHLSDLAGKVVLVNLWATWCPPCVAEMDSLNTVQQRLGGPGFQVVAVSLDRGGAPLVKRWFAKNQISHLAIYTADANQFINAMLPTSILLDAKGRVAWRGVGTREWDGAEAVQAITGLMAEKAD